ncbi:MAG: NAD(P)H-dependent oxidoreductase [Burkholderiales bacterium]|nr:NAD(P)H-dependent oxidoreductase [Burkholderiales bacterium]
MANVLALTGSLRARSYNLAALKAAQELMPEGMKMTIADYAQVPLYNQDVQDQGIPAAVTQLREAILAADGLLIASPEYNFSVSGVLKNAIDWLSRVSPQPFKDKPVAILSVTAGPVGGARSQYELRKILGCLDALVLLKPEVFIGACMTRFDADLKLTDQATRKILGDQMVAFAAWMDRLAKR